MVKATYDLDLICYFRHDETAAGEPPEDLYENTRKALEADYWVEPKASALPLMERNLKVDCLNSTGRISGDMT